MKKYLILIVLPFLLACGSNDKKTTSVEDSLAKAYSELHEKDTIISNREAALVEFIKSFNEIQSNLNQIKAKEKMLRTNTKDVEDIELNKLAKDKIINDIQSIYKRMNENKQYLSSINQKLSDSYLTIDYLETAIDNLKVQIRNNENEMADLKKHLEKRNVDFSNLQETHKELQETYAQEKEASDKKTQLLNTGYYAIGTIDNLKKKGVLTKEGTFSGKTLNLNSSNFTKINIPMVTEIPLKNVDEVKLITAHPTDSYKIIRSNTNDKVLIIMDPQKFWKGSHYLVIEI
jgi:DNA repair exonuclease SbcCD ATPase subunit